jgi:hypothetical protein
VFESSYLPVLVAVVYRTLLAILYSDANLVQPFTQLTRTEGAPAEHVLFQYYQTQSKVKGPFIALRDHSWSLASLTSAFVLVSLLPALASDAFVVQTNQCASKKTQSDANPCPPYMEVRLPVLRTCQVIMVVVAAALVYWLVYGMNEKTGLPANPSSIATVGSIMRHPALLDDLNSISGDASVFGMRKSLRGRRYRLDHYQSQQGGTEHGIVPVADHADLPAQLGGSDPRYAPIERVSTTPCKKRTTKSCLQVADFVLLFVLVGTFAVILAYYFDNSDDDYNRFFSSQTFGPRFILTGAGTVIASMWKTVEQRE